MTKLPISDIVLNYLIWKQNKICIFTAHFLYMSFLTWKLLSYEPFRIELVTKPIVIWFNWNWLAPIHFDMRVLVPIWSWHGLGHFARGKLTACLQIRFLLIHTWLRLFCKWWVRGILHNPIWKYQRFCFHVGILLTDKQRAFNTIPRKSLNLTSVYFLLSQMMSFISTIPPGSLNYGQYNFS